MSKPNPNPAPPPAPAPEPQAPAAPVCDYVVTSNCVAFGHLEFLHGDRIPGELLEDPAELLALGAIAVAE